MPGQSLADALPDFAASAPARARQARHATMPTLGPRTTEAPDPEPQSGMTDMMAAEAERARAEATERLRAEHDAVLAAERERHAAEIDELRGKAGEEAARLISQRLREMEDRIVELTGSITARILASVLADDLRQRALDDLAARIRAAMADNEAVRIRVRGAPTLCQALEKALDTHAEQVDFSPGEGFDLTVTIDDSVYETRLAEWSAAIAEAVA